MTDVAVLGIMVDSKPAVKAESDLDRLTLAAQKAEGATTKLGTAANRNLAPALTNVNKGSILAGNSARMLSQQLSQVGQQTMATGNFIQALAIQLPDIGIAFGAVGGAVGLLAGVGLPLLISALTGTSDQSKAVKDALDGLGDAAGAYIDAVKAAQIPTDELTAKYGSLAAAAREALDAIANVERVNALNATDAAIQSVVESLTEVRAARLGSVLIDDFDMSTASANNLLQSLRALSSASGLPAQAAAAKEVSAALLDAYGSVDAMPAPLRTAYGQMQQIVVSAGEITGAVESANSAMSLFADALGSASGLAANLAGQLSAVAASAWDALGALGQAGQAADPEQFKLAGAYGLYADSRMAAPKTAVGGGRARRASGGGGGGSAATDDFQARLKKLQEENATETQQADMWYEEAQKTLADRRAMEALGEQGHKDLMLQIEADYNDKLRNIQGTAQEKRLSEQAGFWGSLAGIAAAGGEKTTKVVATFEAIQGTIHAYSAAIQALAAPNLTVFGRFAAYASVLAAGLGGVASIKSAGKVSGGSGGGGGSSVSSPAVAAQGATVAEPERNTVITIKGLSKNGLYSGAMLEEIFDGLVDVANLRGVRFVD